jgi:hypothetical protein
MRPIHVHAAVFSLLVSSFAIQADARDNTRYLTLVNRAHDGVGRLAASPAGSDAFREVPIGAPLRGGGESVTVEMPADGCLYDLRFEFRNGRTMVYKDVDLCRYSTVRIRPLPQRDEDKPAYAEQSPDR